MDPSSAGTKSLHHSRRGTEHLTVSHAIHSMPKIASSKTHDCKAVISPCIDAVGSNAFGGQCANE